MRDEDLDETAVNVVLDCAGEILDERGEDVARWHFEQQED